MNNKEKRKEFAKLLLKLNEKTDSKIYETLGRRNVNTLLDIKRNNEVSKQRIDRLNESIEWLNDRYDDYIMEEWEYQKVKLKMQSMLTE